MEGVSPRRGSRKALRKSWHWRASGFPCGTPTVLAVSWERLPKESALFLKSGCKISLKSGTFSILKKNFRIIRIFRSSHTGLCLWYSLRVKMTVFLGFIHWGGGETDHNELRGPSQGHGSGTHHHRPFRFYLGRRVLEAVRKRWGPSPTSSSRSFPWSSFPMVMLLALSAFYFLQNNITSPQKMLFLRLCFLSS